MPTFTKKIFKSFCIILMKKLAIIGSGIAGLTFANMLKKYSDHDFMVYEKEESLPLDEGYGIQLSTNSVKI